ncbi:MAG: flagellar hook-associated protein FlgK [Nitrosomonas sp.]|nr:flagellar hook-associated protein FlgK [Nitrosomonas sp.]
MGSSILNTGISGLMAAQTNLLTTSHNISNADTPGFSRQQAIQTTNIAQRTGSGFIGQGVNVTTVERIYSQFLVTQALQVQTQSSRLDSHFTEIKKIDDMLADTSSGLAPSLENFFSAVHDVASSPAEASSRQALLSNAGTLVSKFHSIDQRLSDIRDGINSQITTNIDKINSLAKQIGELNHNILLTQGASGGNPPNDLLDQRDNLVNQMSELINTDVVEQGNGSLNIFIGSGQALVVGSQTLTLKAMISPSDPEELTVGYVTGNNTVQLPEFQITGGALGGIMEFRRTTLDDTQSSIGRIAIALAQDFNNQHRLGQDLNNTLGADFFTVPTPKVISNAGNNPGSSVTAVIDDTSALTASDYEFTYGGLPLTSTLTRLSDNTSVSALGIAPLSMDGITVTPGPINAGEGFLIQPTINGAKNIAVEIVNIAEIAAAAPIRTEAGFANAGDATISAGTVNPLPVDPNLQQTVTLTFNTPYDGLFDVNGVGTGNPVDVAYTPGADITYNGFTVQINGQPAAGDVFTIEANTGGTADNRNALLLAGLQIQDRLSNGTASYQSSYSQIVSQVGNSTRELEVTSKAQANLLTQSRESIQAISGVNLDEEAANLIRYQQAFQASSKVIQISGTLFDTLLSVS